MSQSLENQSLHHHFPSRQMRIRFADEVDRPCARGPFRSDLAQFAAAAARHLDKDAFNVLVVQIGMMRSLRFEDDRAGGERQSPSPDGLDERTADDDLQAGKPNGRGDAAVIPRGTSRV